MAKLSKAVLFGGVINAFVMMSDTWSWEQSGTVVTEFAGAIVPIVTLAIALPILMIIRRRRGRQTRE